MIVAILIGRKKSKGFPGKNLHKVLGRPLAYYPMKAAKDCPEIDKVYISTDDEKLSRLARKNGLDIIKRPIRLCTDKALGEDVYVHAYNYAKQHNKRCKIEMVVLLMCNTAAITSGMISKGIRALRKNPNYDSAVTVSKYNMWSPLRARKINKDGLLKPFVPFETFGNPKTLNCDRDSQGDVWFADMGVSIVRPRCLEHLESGLLPQKWMGQKIYPLKQWGGLDVDHEWQLPQVEYWLRSRPSVKKCQSKSKGMLIYEH
ncbi:cytidylyltransferase domain-containing protein [Candidatus Omnitrophota bacterium]